MKEVVSISKTFRASGIHGESEISLEAITALLARLEASERVCEALRRYLVNQDHEDFDVALIAWKKSKGLA